MTEASLLDMPLSQALRQVSAWLEICETTQAPHLWRPTFKLSEAWVVARIAAGLAGDEDTLVRVIDKALADFSKPPRKALDWGDGKSAVELRDHLVAAIGLHGRTVAQLEG